MPLAKRCCSGRDARFSGERPDRLRVPNSEHRLTRLRVPNSKHRITRLRFPTPSTATPSTETQSESPGTPTGSNSAVPEANPASTTIQPRKAAVPDILIAINKPTQRMTVTVNGHVRYRWRVSTGATKYSTPPGSYKAFRMERMHYSREWDNAGMPHSIFFSSRGHAIHGSDHPRLGTPASHGCVRLSLGNAATLFALVSARGVSNTKVVVRGPDPPGYHAATQIPQRRTRPVGLFGGFFPLMGKRS